MKISALSGVLIAASCILSVQAPANAQDLSPELRAKLPVVSLAGQAKLRFFGFAVYQASLWVSPGFSESAYEQSSFALDLAYLRNFKGADIATRSLTEMQRQATLPAEQQTRWENQMRAIFPDVTAGDRITGVNQPGVGAAFWHNGRFIGEIRDPVFSRLFFGIWLATKTSEPALRLALLAQAKAK